MEGPSSIKGGEDAAPCKGRQIVGDVGKREGVLLSDSIEPPVIDSPTNFPAVHLWNWDKGEGPRRVRFLYDSLFQPSVDLLSQGFLHYGVQWSMLHLDQGGSWVNSYCVRDYIGLTVTTDGDYTGELKESPDDILPEAGIPLQQRRRVEVELGNQPLDFSILGKSVKLFMCGGFRRRRSVCMDSGWGDGNLLHRSDDGILLDVDIFALQVVDKNGQTAVSLHLM